MGEPRLSSNDQCGGGVTSFLPLKCSPLWKVDEVKGKCGLRVRANRRLIHSEGSNVSCPHLRLSVHSGLSLGEEGSPRCLFGLYRIQFLLPRPRAPTQVCCLLQCYRQNTFIRGNPPSHHLLNDHGDLLSSSVGHAQVRVEFQLCSNRIFTFCFCHPGRHPKLRHISYALPEHPIALFFPLYERRRSLLLGQCLSQSPEGCGLMPQFSKLG